jgi:hypothetical protein
MAENNSADKGELLNRGNTRGAANRRTLLVLAPQVRCDAVDVGLGIMRDEIDTRHRLDTQLGGNAAHSVGHLLQVDAGLA